MNPIVNILPAADLDLDEQADYLAREASPETAVRFYDAAIATFESLARMPGIGERWKSANPRLAGLRTCRIERFANHLVFYRPIEGGIEVVRVLHGARDLPAALESTGG